MLDDFQFKYCEKIKFSSSISNTAGHNYCLTLRKRIGKQEEILQKEYKDNIFDFIEFSLMWSLDMDKVVFVQSITDMSTNEVLNNFIQNLSDVFMSPDMQISKKQNNGVVLTLKATIEDNSNPLARIKLKGKSQPKQGGGFFGECDPFFRIKRLSKNYGDMITVYESGVFRNEKNPKFKKILMSQNRLCDGRF